MHSKFMNTFSMSPPPTLLMKDPSNDDVYIKPAQKRYDLRTESRLEKKLIELY